MENIQDYILFLKGIILRLRESELYFPRTGAFATISPLKEMSGTIRAMYDDSFGEDTGAALRWLHNRRISQEDTQALEVFSKELAYSINYE